MKSVRIFLFASILLFITGANVSYGLQQVAGKIVVELKAGETKTVQWGLLSDNQNDVTTVELKADGKGAEFLSFPKTVRIDPGQLVFVDITVTVPSDFTKNIELNPALYATEFGEKGGSTVMNIQMKKELSIVVGSISEQESNLEKPPASEATQTQSTTTPEKEQTKPEEKPAVLPEKEQESKAGGGGCLIATATFGSELAPQIQQLRETRDKILLHTQSGSAFMNSFNAFYYSFSPTVADWERQNFIFKEAVKISITPLITTLSVLNYVDIDSEAKMLGYGIGVILLNIGMYFVAPAFVIMMFKHKIHKMKLKLD